MTSTIPAVGPLPAPETFRPEKVTLDGISVEQLQHHLTLLKWFKELESGDVAADKRFLLLAEQRYEAWARILQSLADRPNDVPVPPIDIAYMWHSHMLSPHRYYEDNYYLQRRDTVMNIAFPLRQLHDTYMSGKKPSDTTIRQWEKVTHLPYKLDIADHPDYKSNCKWCDKAMRLDWPTIIDLRTAKVPKSRVTCDGCQAEWNRDTVSGHLFWTDVKRYLDDPAQSLVRGAILSPGMGFTDPSAADQDHVILFDGLSSEDIQTRLVDWKACQWKNIIADLKEVKTRAISRRRWRAIHPQTVDKMGGAYRELTAPFSLDLCLAVQRQRKFTDTMANIQWDTPTSLGM
ncbi:hypothetical protein SYNPS1DRAFT_29313 [Syncephalis pseudoplumigaleata]|uniref:Uncharacterized protein n=1 Tax=Syncephalis pseudoplumigaleata TaxID=1712513 RepID=A0A4P9YYE6_9FUNG|nr:hypothetical protein SYNPS1DRAFT_29313 [Syncephalis pseudoplumigaleata]|eukprot:RKP24945.1 hypothetical protein SYNPS1DRAFT_29313 [Syncephalis pseudoplumigaleata]